MAKIDLTEETKAMRVFAQSQLDIISNMKEHLDEVDLDVFIPYVERLRDELLIINALERVERLEAARVSREKARGV